MGFAAGELQVVFHPVLGGEEPEITKRLRGVEVIGDCDGGGVGLAAELFDPGRPRRGGGAVEVGGIERFEHRQPLCAVLDRRGNPFRIDLQVSADGDVDDRIEPRGRISPIPVEPVTQPRLRRRLADPRILDNDHGSIMTKGCHTVAEGKRSGSADGQDVGAPGSTDRALGDPHLRMGAVEVRHHGYQHPYHYPGAVRLFEVAASAALDLNLGLHLAWARGGVLLAHAQMGDAEPRDLRSG